MNVHGKRPSAASIWWQAARPKTLTAALAPVAVATALAVSDGLFQWLPALVALLCAALIQLGTNFANDLFDFLKGADTDQRRGPTRATQAGWVSIAEMKWATAAAFGLALLLGLYLVAVGGWPILLVGLLSVLAGIAYTGGPWPLGYHGLGDVFVFIFFGVVAVVGSYYVQALQFSVDALLLSVPVGLAATAILMVNNIRDIDTDRKACKNTLAVRLGRSHSRHLYALTLAACWLLLPVFIALGLGDSWLLLPCLLLPLAAKLIATIYRSDDADALNTALASTAKLGLLYGLLLSAAIVLGR